MSALVAGGVFALGANNVHAATRVDNDHVQVESGDTLSQIAQENNMGVDQLAQINHIQNDNLIHVGDKLVITPSATTENNNNNQATTVNTSATTNSNTGNGNTNATTSNGSVHDQFISAGGTEAMWNAIVMPESGGNPNATNGQYQGLGQTNQSWGTGSVAEQTQGMINYANSRYGSVSNAVNFRMSHNFW